MNETELKYARKLADAFKGKDKSFYNHKTQLIGEKDDWRDSRYGIKVEIKDELKQKNALPSNEDVVMTVAKITFMTMYDHDADFTMDDLEIVAKVFGSRKINIGSREGYSSGCETCGHGGRYGIDLFVLDAKI